MIVICDNSNINKTDISYFKVENTKKLISLLKDGKKLKYKHPLYGNVDIYMNFQKNKMVVSDNNYITADNIKNCMLGYGGKWYLYE